MPSPDAASPRERSWFHWGMIVAGLYLTWFIALTLPLLMTSFVSMSDLARFPKNASDLVEVYESWIYWILVGILCLSQFLFLRMPVRLATKRTVSRRSIWLPVVVSGFWFALIVWGAGLALMEVAKAEAFEKLGEFIGWTIGIALLSWIFWSVVFYRIGGATDPKAAIEQQSRWLLRGSILELLVAVPSHIVARGRSDCCAGLLTFVGITMGLTVMLLSFGPAVFLLYHARWKRLKGLP